MKIRSSGFKHLIRMMKVLDDQVQRCSRCGMCQAVCPLYAATGQERDVARGKLLLLNGLMREMFQNPEGVAQRIDHCLLCGACEAGCPRQVSAMEIFLTARSIMATYQGLSPVKKFFFRQVMARPKFFNSLVEWAARIQFLFVKPSGIQADASCPQLVSPILSNRHIIPLAPIPFHQMEMHVGRKACLTGPRVAFFVGCLLDKLFPETAKTIVDVLAHHGANVLIPPSQGCCGIPMLAAGDREAFNRLVDHHLQIFNAAEFDYLVTGCATCTAVIKRIWPAMAELKSISGKKAIIGLADKTYDISEFLVKIMGVSPLQNSLDPDVSKTKVTYHDPCHLRKTLKISKEPRMLIHASPGYAFSEMPEPDSCCGMGGSFNLKYYGTSTDIGLKKVEKIRASGAEAVATGCPACMIQLKDMLAKANAHVEVKHVIEIYSEGLAEKTEPE